MGAQRGQGLAVLVADEQGGEEPVTDLLGVADLGEVGLGRVGLVVEPGPVDGDEGEVTAARARGVSCGVEQGLSETGEAGAGVLVEAPGGHGGGVGRTLTAAGQDARPGGDRVRVPGVFGDELFVAVLEALLHSGYGVSHTLILRLQDLCREFRA